MQSNSRTHLSRVSKADSSISRKNVLFVPGSAKSGADEPLDPSPSCSTIAGLSPKKSARKPKEKLQKRAATQWGIEEIIIFYEALKENGKNFEQISYYLEKKKYVRDKDQIKNFYYNTYKMYKEKAGITDEEWDGAPHGARELFIVLNALEWKKRTSNGVIQPQKFKSLVLTGSAVLKIPQKRSSITIKTPSCVAFHKYFPSLRQYARAPQTVSVFLTPYSYTSKHYVNTKCEVNPILNVNIPCGASLSQLFDFLEQKWQFCEGEEITSRPIIRLYSPDDFKPSLVELRFAKETIPSLNSLKQIRKKNKEDRAEYLDFGDIFKNGIDRTNCHTLNFLQLFLFFNESEKITLRYEIACDTERVNCFEKLNELFVECDDIFAELKMDKRFKEFSESSEGLPSKRQPNKRLAEVVCNQGNVVDNERNMFVKQLAMLRKTGRDNKKRKGAPNMPRQSPSPSTSKEMPTDFSPIGGQSVSVAEFATSTESAQQPVHVQLECFEQPLEFDDDPHEDRQFFEMQSYPRLEGIPGSSNTFDQILNEPGHPEFMSPSKSLLDDTFHLFDSMMDVNSCDLIANFSQLVNHMNDSQSQFSNL
ncbi:unnamed protein product [Bursaphelenchus xylophilus]|uniref:(pine wood nematode) hypothetical protein n=1 Tax=Bursaphelenchus xylophilus TaxID=6326 RepID=A0A1I7STH8_BURXY|nr:unnamed protein product [Bursaphelenchus xylophilus]CAG9108400.1 unnamed protein product [Bursaphelenchus xylophilus]